MKHYLHNDFDSANSLKLRFTRRLPVDEALAKKNVNDYRQAIYTVAQSEEAKVNINIDFQYYFDPALTDPKWAKDDFVKFSERGIVYLEGEFEEWLKKLRDEKAA